MVGHALRVVAGAHGNDAARTLFLRQQRELVAGTAFLERSGELQVFKLQEDLRADDFRQRSGFNAGRVEHLALQALGGVADVLERKHGLHCAAARHGWRGARTTMHFFFYSCQRLIHMGLRPI